MSAKVNMNAGRRIFSVLIVFCLVFTTAYIMFIADEVPAPNPPQIDPYGNLNVTGQSTCIIENYSESSPFRQSGNINVNDSSTLIIRNSTVLMNPDAYHIYNITVTENSKLIIDNSVFTVDTNPINPSYDLFFHIKDSTLEIIDSQMIFPGLLNISSSDFIAINSIFKELANPPFHGSAVQLFNDSTIYYEDCMVEDFTSAQPIRMINGSTMVAINTYFDLNYLGRHMVVDDNSNAKFYGVTVAPGSWPYSFKPIDVLSSNSWVNIYRWLYINITDLLGIPLGNTVVEVKNITNQYAPTPPMYILNYLNKQTSNYNITNSSGYVILPLISDNLTYNSMPNSIFTGNYQIIAYHGQHMTSKNMGLPAYPLLTKDSNEPNGTLSFSDLLISPSDNTYYEQNTLFDIVITTGEKGTIYNSLYQKPAGGVINMTFGQQGNIIVNGSGPGGQLDLSSSRLGIEQDETHKYYILLEEDGQMNLMGQSAIMDGIVTPGTYPVNVYMEDSSVMSLKENSALEDLGVLGMQGTSKITFDSSEIHGGLFYASGSNQNLQIAALNHSRINVTKLTLSDATVMLENSNVTTISEPTFKNVDMVASNTSFNQPLTFSDGSTVELINVAEPSFFNITATDNSQVDVYWWLTVVVKDSQGNHLDGADVFIWNYTNKAQLYPVPYAQGTTNEDGEVTLPVLGGVINSSGRLFGGLIGNYYINATYLGSGSRSARQSQGSGTDVFGQNQELVIIIPGSPDLEVLPEGVHIAPDPGVKNDITKVKGVIHNRGNFTALNVGVEFWDMVESELLGKDMIDFIPPAQSRTAEIDYKFTVEGEYNILVYADPEEVIGETNENNNYANNTINIENRDRADLIFIQNSLFTEPASPIANETEVTVGVQIKNDGIFEATNFVVQFYIKAPGETGNGTQLGENITIASLLPGATVTKYADTTWIAKLMSGIEETYQIVAMVDVGKTVPEYNETNNSITLPVQVVIGPDLTVTSISFNPTTPTRENEFTISAIIKNNGPSSVSNFTVGFAKDTQDNWLGAHVLVTEFLNAGVSTEVTFPISKAKAIMEFSEARTYTIYVEADPNKLISETDEGNNVLDEDTLVIKLKADLSIIANEIKFEELEVENGVETNLRALVRNIGETNSDEYTVKFFDGDPKNERQIDTDQELSSLVIGGLAEVKVTWSSTMGGWHNIWVQIETQTDEESVANNIAFNSIYVKTKPDLTIAEEDIIIVGKENAEIIVGEVIEIQVTIHNIGDTAAKNFDVELWDGTPNAAGSVSIANSNVINLDGHTDRILLSGSYAFTTPGNHPIYVDIDPDNRIPEKDESNNIISKDYWINESAADLLITNWVLKSATKAENYNQFINGEQFWFEFQFLNDGTELARNITVTLYQDDFIEIDNTTISEIGEKGDATWKTREITATYLQNYPDYHKIILKIDPADEIRELNEDNNLLEITQGYKVINANLEITNVEIRNQKFELIFNNGRLVKNAQKGDVLGVEVTITNLGSQLANVTVKIRKEGILIGSDTKEIGFETEPEVNNVKEYNFPGLEVTGPFSIDVEVSGDYFVETSLDITEPISIPVEKGADDPDDDGLPWLWIILIIIIIVVCVVVGTIFFMKRKREKMAECSECGALIPIDADSCAKCGAEFSDEIECGECGALMKVTDTACPVCGAVFTKEAEKEAEEEEMEGEVEGKAKPPAPPIKPRKPPAAPPAKQKAPAPKPPSAAPAAAKPPAAAAPAPAAAAPAAGDEEKAECYRCGAIVPLSASMCPECGAEFE